RDAAFRTGDPAFAERFRAADAEVAASLEAAVAAFPRTRLTPGHARLISAICVEAGVQGHRGDVLTGQTARALAALREHRSPTRDDVYDAAELALAHRARARIRRDQPDPQQSEETQQREGDEEQPQQGDTTQPGASESEQQVGGEEQEASQAD